MESFQILSMVVDEGQYDEQHVTAQVTHDGKEYSVTFDKDDFELINAWIFEKETSLPANLSDEEIEVIRNEVRGRL
ncbi:hypothetical protein [Metabacillus malikii]|uniref:Type IV secretory pathway ATPase VirB11/archaellum biosynthesis ATPase n=1 Tax=Metabacillus malikii TaxID=1504265 RepID=A0ABT9ZCR4_9BACI|nr:hypothetical protein [Metabacillus malikii]MDQ0230039.1 type IV secretory pathway ATPase VirB11/archaellum biosynthesis ATPase [Metabacillus malikii]